MLARPGHARRSRPRDAGLTALLVVALLAAACTGTDDGPDAGESGDRGDLGAITAGETAPATFVVAPGVEQATVTGANPHAELALFDAEGIRRLTLVADDAGQATFSYIPSEPQVFETGGDGELPTLEGGVLEPGPGYRIVDESSDPPQVSDEFTVLDRDDHPDPFFYEGQTLEGVHWGLQGPVDGEPDDGFGYIETRDGTELSAMVRLPDPTVWGDGPYPTVIEYSGYGPSRPEGPEPGSMIATLLGYATVGVNMRGTGCSGGVFDVFNPAQQADGYDVVEAVAAQDWVQGGRVGMVGLSYSGISQLYVASTAPPHLAAVTPLSVIDDPWRAQWPGGVYNDGFTRQWLSERDRQSEAGGVEWVTERIDAGDEVCATNQEIRSQNVDFESFGRSLEFYPPAGDGRRLDLLVPDIDVPVYLTGAWQDEQTGARFATLLDDFDSAPVKRFTVFNGHHPDGYSPLVLTRWWEFLELYVAERVPELDPLFRAAAPAIFQAEFGVPLGFEPDRFEAFGEDDYEAALAQYEAEPEVRILFESGTGYEVPGAPQAAFEATFDSWPPPSEAREWYFGPGGTLVDEAPREAGTDSYRHDPDAGTVTYTDAGANDFQDPLVETNWEAVRQGDAVSYVSEPLADDVVIAGDGHVTLWMAPGAEDATVEVTLSEVQPDGTEFRVQGGWLRLGHRGIDQERSDGTYVEYTFLEEDFETLVPGEMIEVQVPLYPVAHAFRSGSKLRLTVDTPGRDTPLWEFGNPSYDGDVRHEVAWGDDMASGLVLPVVEGVEIVGPFPTCPSLRGQVCRPYVAVTNETNEPGG